MSVGAWCCIDPDDETKIFYSFRDWTAEDKSIHRFTSDDPIKNDLFDRLIQAEITGISLDNKGWHITAHITPEEAVIK